MPLDYTGKVRVKWGRITRTFDGMEWTPDNEGTLDKILATVTAHHLKRGLTDRAALDQLVIPQHTTPKDLVEKILEEPPLVFHHGKGRIVSFDSAGYDPGGVVS